MLVPVLEEARRRGFLGPGPVEAHLDHATGFAEAALAAGFEEAGAVQAADLGSGGGVPGLPLAVRFPRWTWLLVESGVRRAAFLREAVASLGLGGRITVAEARAETVGRSPVWRHGLEVIVARGFGPPAVVAECAAPLLRVGGCAIVSEPPGGAPERWPSDGLALLGMTPGPSLVVGGAAYQVVTQTSPCPDRYSRRVGVPVKRPLF